MRWPIQTLILYLFCLQICAAQNKIHPELAVKDLDYLKAKLNANHLALRNKELKKNVDSTINVFQNAIKDSLNTSEMFELVSNIVANINDLHTSVQLPKKLNSLQKKRFPFYIRSFNDKYYIHYNAAQDSSILRTAELLKINNVAISDYIHRFEGLIGTDFNNEWSKKYYAERSFSYYFKELNVNENKVLIEYQNPKDTISTKKTIDFLDNKEIVKNIKKRYKNSFKTNFEYKILDSLTKTSYLIINSFNNPKKVLSLPTNGFKKALKKRFAAIDKFGVQNLIIDFRGNGGGSIRNVARLNSYFAPAPFNLMESVYITKTHYHRMFSIKKIIAPLIGPFFFKKIDSNTFIAKHYFMFREKSKHHFNGKLYALIDAGSYSATTFACSILNDMNLATFVGSTPSGANWGSFAGTWQNIKLPNSQIVVRCPNMKISYAQPQHRLRTPFIEPEIKIEPSFGDFLKREDTQLKYLLDYIKKPN